MKTKMMKKLLAGVLAFCCAMPSAMPTVYAAESALEEYVIYPTPHEMQYDEGTYILREDINVIYDEEIDEATKDRMEEVAELKGLDVNESDDGTAMEGMTNVYVGVYDSDDVAEAYISAHYDVEDTLFQKTDAYLLISDNNVISILGKDTDASFYGLTTLYHVLAQMESLTIRNFTVKDYADVESRGFIEGYYGNPWSTEDRCNLMEWSGYYKLNSYFYAPKDDPKHNSNWRALYTEEEIETKIRPLAEAGNASKCRFVYALHPYMYNAINYSSDATYQADLAIMQAKFAQVIEAGVRQIAILADDATNVGSANYIKTLEDMTEWIEEMQKTYPDLKLTLPFCTQEYMSTGQTYYSEFPENVQIVMTGGKVWGEVTDNFTTTFTNTVGRGPYMWINWPCTDNSKKHLIMGGYTTFLHPGVDASKIQGIVLNPMQQSEPSKVAIFGNAAYSWNIWETQEEADAAWEASFAFVDHNSAVGNAASDALKELSKHMINQNMDSRVTVLQESVVLKEKLNAFKSKLEDGTVTAADADDLIAEFEVLQDASKTYRQSAGDTNVRDQIVYWLNCWDDTTTAAIAYLNGVKAILNGETTAVVTYNSEGKNAFDASKSYGFWYVDHTEYAEVGVQHIVPFINTLASYVSTNMETIIDPDKVISTYITNRTDSPATGSVDNIFDGDDTTGAIYKTPNAIKQGDYVGVQYNQVVSIQDIRFVLGAGKDHMDSAKLQYTVDGQNWVDMTLVGMDNAFTGTVNVVQDIAVAKENLPADFKAMGIRLIATANNTNDAWFEVREVQINKNIVADEVDYVFTNVTDTEITATVEQGMVSLEPVTVILAAGEYVGIDLNGIKAIEAITTDVTADESVVLQTSMNGVFDTQKEEEKEEDKEEDKEPETPSEDDGWTDYYSLRKERTATTAEEPTDVRYVRLYNSGTTEQTVVIDQFKVQYTVIGEKTVSSTLSQGSTARDMRTLGNVSDVFDGDLTTYGEITSAQTAGGTIVFDLGQEREIHSIRYYITETNLDYLRHAKFEVANSPDAAEEDWTEVLVVGSSEFGTTEDSSTTAKDAPYLTHDSVNPGNMYAEATGLNATGRYLRIVLLSTYTQRWMQFNEIQINGGAYVSEEANRDIITDAIEEDFKVPSNMLDGEYTTTYKSTATNSQFVYRISSAEQRSIRIIQNGELSGAVVSAKIYDGTTLSDWTELGHLDNVINEFAVGSGEQLLEIKVSWTDVIPEISIMKTSTTAQSEVDKTALKAELAQKEDALIATWTEASQKTYQVAYDAAKALENNVYVTKEIVDATTAALKTARENAIVKGDASKLETALANKKEGTTDGVEIYTPNSYAVYSAVMNKVQELVANKENVSATEVDAVWNELVTAEAGLIYSYVQRELAAALLADHENKYAQADYSAEVYQFYMEAKTALSEKLQADETARVNPVEMYEVRMEYLEAVQALETGVLPVCDHKETEKQNVKAATCTTEGYTGDIVCKQCGVIVEAGKVVLASHSLKVVPGQAATSSKAGYESYQVCTVCSYQETKKTIAKIKSVKLSKTSYAYNGKVQKPTVTVKDANGKTISSKYYSVSYSSGCKKVGKYTVKITFKGDYAGTVKKTFTINPKAMSFKSVKGAKKAISLKWKKQTKEVTGYQIQYATNKSFTKGKKVVTVKKAKTTSLTIKKLSAKKTYYVRIRTYKKVSGKTYYSAWSAVKKVKTK